MQELYNRVELKERQWIIQKFDARTGMKMARLVMSRAQPLMPLLRGGGELSEDKSFSAVFAVLGGLEDEDIDKIVDTCLRFCYEDLPAGRQAVIDRNGNYGVEGVEYDMGLTLMLCYEAIKWGASDFFDGSSSISSLFRK